MEMLDFEPMLLEGSHDRWVVLAPILAHHVVAEVEDLTLKNMLHRSRRVPLNVQIKMVDGARLLHGVL